MPRGGALLVGIGLAAGVGIGAYYLGRRKKEPSPRIDLNVVRAAGEAAIDVALTACPDKAEAINAAGDAFDREILAMGPAEALTRLQEALGTACPAIRGVPGVTRPNGFPAPPSGDRPSPGTSPPTVRLPPNADALAILIRDAGSDVCNRADLVLAFQRATNQAAGQALLAEDGAYDFTTAVAVQVRLTAQAAGIAPTICGFPGFTLQDAQTGVEIVERYRNELSDLYQEVQ